MKTARYLLVMLFTLIFFLSQGFAAPLPADQTQARGYRLGDVLRGVEAKDQNGALVNTANSIGKGQVTIIQACEWFCVPCYVATGVFIGTLNAYLIDSGFPTPRNIATILNTAGVPATIYNVRMNDSANLFGLGNLTQDTVAETTLIFRSVFFGDSSLLPNTSGVTAFLPSNVTYISLQADDFDLTTGSPIPSDQYSAKIYQALYYRGHAGVILHDDGVQQGPISRFLKTAKITGVPAFFVMDKQGRLIYKNVGFGIMAGGSLDDISLSTSFILQLINLAINAPDQVDTAQSISNAINFTQNINSSLIKDVNKQQLLRYLETAQQLVGNGKTEAAANQLANFLHSFENNFNLVSPADSEIPFVTQAAPIWYNLVIAISQLRDS